MGLGVRCFRRMWVVGYEIFCEGYGEAVGEREYDFAWSESPPFCFVNTNIKSHSKMRGGVISDRQNEAVRPPQGMELLKCL